MNRFPMTTVTVILVTHYLYVMTTTWDATGDDKLCALLFSVINIEFKCFIHMLNPNSVHIYLTVAYYLFIYLFIH